MAPTSDKSSSHSSGTEVPPPSKRTEEALADHLRAEASKQMAIRHASAVAAASIEKKLAGTTSTGETVRLTRQLTEFQKCSLQSELAFLEALNRMTNEQKLQTLFMLFDSDGSGTVSSQEMARCLKKMDTVSRAHERCGHVRALQSMMLTHFDFAISNASIVCTP
jgi:uncharacterized protein YkwD